MKRAIIYRFGDCVAVSMNGSVGYLPQDEAQRMVETINHVITSIAMERFSKASLGSFEVQYASSSGEAAALSEASFEAAKHIGVHAKTEWCLVSCMHPAAPKGWDRVEGDDT